VGPAQEVILSSAAVSAWARDAGFELVGFARAEPIPPRALTEWLEAGFDADLDWMRERLAERLEVSRLLPGAKTVVAFANNYWSTDAASPIARYARGRDYHYTMKDRLRALRRTLRAQAPTVKDYASVDAAPVMEKVWAARAGLGYVGRNGCLITERFGSWVLLAAMVLDVEVDAYAARPAEDRCGSCNLCVSACPTSAIVADAVVDARLCLSYQTIENEAPMPEPLRPAMADLAFGCDICQEVCPLNQEPLPAHERFAPRPVSALTVKQLAGLSAEEYQTLAPGTPLARAKYDGLRRNAAYALGAARDRSSQQLLERLVSDPSAAVREAAAWALTRLGPAKS
jgi:epoxyqueuosine reductase